jgi:hypothetical protein
MKSHYSKQLSIVKPEDSIYLVVSKFYMRRVRYVLHQRIIPIEQIPLDCHRGVSRVIELFRQPETNQKNMLLDLN